MRVLFVVLLSMVLVSMAAICLWALGIAVRELWWIEDGRADTFGGAVLVLVISAMGFAATWDALKGKVQ